MSLFFKSKTKSFLGVDIGLSGIKIVELANDGGHARLVTYAYVDRPVENFDQLFNERVEETADIIKQMLAKSRCTTKTAIAAVPVSSIFTSIISEQRQRVERGYFVASEKIDSRAFGRNPAGQ